MSIATAITAAQGKVANAYTAVSTKGGTLPATQNLSNLPTAISSIPSGGGGVITSLSVTPTTSAQTITASGGVDGYSPISVSAVTSSIDNNIVAGNIKSGVTILGVSGTVTALNGDTLSVTPTTSAQTLTPTSPKNGYTQVSVSAVTSSIDANITAGNIKKNVTILGVTGTYEGSGGGTPTFSIEVPLTRFKDDNNNQIGTHYMNFVDANGNAYKVILLDAQYRKASAQWCSNTTAVTNLPNYGAVKDTNPWEAKETATTNTQLILNFCSSNGYTSSACTHCRSKSFVVGGVTYYGQLPSSVEILYLARHYNEFDSYDTSASSQTSLNFSSASRTIWSSTQINGTTGARLNSGGTLNSTNKTSNYFACPVLEIPF